MNRKYIAFVVLVATATLLSTVPSCGRSQQLVGITIQPASVTYGSPTTAVSQDAGLNTQLQALGSYIHPPVTKDITDRVTWASNETELATVSSTGLLTATGVDCGNALISASVVTNSAPDGENSSGAEVIGYMTANVVCPTPAARPFSGAKPMVSVHLSGEGSGSVSGSSPGLTCASAGNARSRKMCSATFAAGSTVTLTAKPDGAFAGWTGCDAVFMNGLTCRIDKLTEDREITAEFR